LRPPPPHQSRASNTVLAALPCPSVLKAPSYRMSRGPPPARLPFSFPAAGPRLVCFSSTLCVMVRLNTLSMSFSLQQPDRVRAVTHSTELVCVQPAAAHGADEQEQRVCGVCVGLVFFCRICIDTTPLAKATKCTQGCGKEVGAIQMWVAKAAWCVARLVGRAVQVSTSTFWCACRIGYYVDTARHCAIRRLIDEQPTQCDCRSQTTWRKYNYAGIKCGKTSIAPCHFWPAHCQRCCFV
jgi:hypothetical protein